MQWPLNKEYHESDSKSQPILDKNDEQLSRPPNNSQDTNTQYFEEDSLSSYSSSSSFSSWNSEDEHSGHRQGRRNIYDIYNRRLQSDRTKVNNKRRLSLTPDRSNRVRPRSRSRSRSRGCGRGRGSTHSFDRSPSPCSDEVDEFGRVKRRRRKFYVQRSDGNRTSDEGEGIITESDSGSDGAYRRWRDGGKEEYERNQSRRRSSEKDERRRKSGRRRRKTDDVG